MAQPFFTVGVGVDEREGGRGRGRGRERKRERERASEVLYKEARSAIPSGQ